MRSKFVERDALRIVSVLFTGGLLGLAAFLVTGAAPSVHAHEAVTITQETDIKSVTKRVTAGASIVLADGIWRDVDLKFEGLIGTSEAPIQIRAQTPGKVVLTGAARFRFSGQHIVVSGLVFRDIDDVSDVVQLRTHSKRHAHHCRFTDCLFEQTRQSATGVESRWLSVYGTHNRIDHCSFIGKKSRGTTLVVWVGEPIEKHRIDHNHFGRRPELGRNGGETIRIGTSQTSELTSQTTVEDNYFFQCDGEAEIVSNKSCENTFRHNVFEQCAGALTLRHGHRCQVDSNVFLGRQKRGTGGVRIIGQGHVVTNNYFESLRGDAERAAISLMNGVPNGALNTYAPVRGANVAHNTLIDCKVPIELGVGASKQQTAIAMGCRFVNNLFSSEKWPLLRIHKPPVDSVWDGNRRLGKADERQPFEFDRVDVLLRRATDGLLRPRSASPLLTNVASTVDHDLDDEPRGGTSVAGCDHPTSTYYDWPKATTTGPSWRKHEAQSADAPSPLKIPL